MHRINYKEGFTMFSSISGNLAGAAGMLCALAVMPLEAQQAAAQRISFDEAVRIALQQNPALLQARNASSLDALTVRQQKLQFLPDLRFSSQTGQSYGRIFNEDAGSVINRTTNSMNAGVSSSVVLFNGMANVAFLREAQLEQDAGEFDFRRARQTVVFTTATNFLALLQHQENLRMRRQALSAEEALESQIRQYVDAGVRTIADLYQQQASVATARSALVQADRAVELAKVDLIQTLQLDPRGSYDFVAPPVDTAPARQTFSLDSLLARAYAQRPDLQAGESRNAAAEQGVKASSGARLPAVSLSAGYNTSYSSASNFNFTDQLDQRRGGSLGLGLSFPLWDRGSTQIATERARIAADNAKLSLVNMRQQAALQVRRAYLDLNAAQEQLHAAEAQQRAASLALQTSEERYRVGAATLVELTQARAAQVQAATALLSARYNLLFQRTLISYYVGDLDPEDPELS
jgi:outer membrane protein